MTIETLRALQKRVRDCTEADRDLDAWIIVMLTPTKATEDDLVYLIKTEPEDHCAPGTYWRKSRSGASLHTAPLLTTYPDGLGACVALMREVLPGCEWERSQRGSFRIYYGWLEHLQLWRAADAKPLANDCLTFLDAIFSAAIAELEARETVG